MTLFATAIVALALAGVSNVSAEDSLDLTQYQGRVVVLDFWASWCVPCRRSFPWMNAMHEKYADKGLVIIAVNVDKKIAAANEFLEAYPADFRIAYDPEAKLAREHGVEAMPTTYIIGRDGEITSRHVGFKVKRQEEYEAAIEAALQPEDPE